MTNSKVQHPESAENAQARFGTFGGVFTPCVLTILGVIMFMRTGFVVGYAGIWTALLILLISKSITSLTALSIGAISTNTRIKGGGVYYMISRVLGPDFGGSIGITLFLAQAVGVAFYVIGFTEALMSVATPLLLKVELGGLDGVALVEQFKVTQLLSSGVIVGLFMLTSKGADIAIKAQFVVLAVLFLAIVSFIVGGIINFDSDTFAASQRQQFDANINFWLVFAIFFPATTGITAGANMSGDLKDSSKSIPWGTILAIIFTAAVYLSQMILMAGASNREVLQEDGGAFRALQTMSIAGPLVVLGVFAATISSALGSFLGAPRILQAMGQDRLMKVMVFFGKGEGPTNEPKRATTLTFIIAVAIIWAGDLNAVAEVISMFFLIAYGMINLSAFVESKSGNPSFRPTFRYFHWVTALIGAIGCMVAMIKINETYAIIAAAITAAIYFYLNKQNIKTNYGDAKRGFIFQRTKDNLLLLEDGKAHPKNWRPIVLGLCMERTADHELVRALGWLESGRGLLSVARVVARPPETSIREKLHIRDTVRDELRRVMKAEGVEGFAEALVSDKYRTGLRDFLQAYSLGALRPNTVMLQLDPKNETVSRDHLVENVDSILAFDLNLVLMTTGRFSPEKKRLQIDLWWRGERNGSLMVIFAYLLTQHATLGGALLRFLRIVKTPEEKQQAEADMREMRDRVRVPAAIDIIVDNGNPKDVIVDRSMGSDIVFLGLGGADGEEIAQFLDNFKTAMEKLPMAVFFRSNGEADIFV